jgi:hypothetical protein
MTMRRISKLCRHSEDERVDGSVILKLLLKERSGTTGIEVTCPK